MMMFRNSNFRPVCDTCNQPAWLRKAHVAQRKNTFVISANYRAAKSKLALSFKILVVLSCKPRAKIFSEPSFCLCVYSAAHLF